MIGSCRGRYLQFFYDQAYSYGTTNPDNNGNLRAAKHYRPLDETSSTFAISTDYYDYDELNRLKWVTEYYVDSWSAETQQFLQDYDYDRYGNRTIKQDTTWGNGINKKKFDVSGATNNRLTVPAGQSGTMTYDSVGNLTTDSYSGYGATREYDAENRMTKETQAGSVAGLYTYNADGQRVRRKVNGTETWQVYGMDGELLAEYAVNGATGSPQTEYGYRNGQLLITAEPSAQINWLVADQLGTPRIILDKTGALATVKRHDYLPFGEELFALIGGRTTTQGYIANGIDGVRQKFTSKERDNETGLDFSEARYYSSNHGRFTSVDPVLTSIRKNQPQTWNRYSYVLNNPLVLVDPLGLGEETPEELANRLLAQNQNQTPTTNTPPIPTAQDTALIQQAAVNQGPLTNTMQRNAAQALQDAIAMVAQPAQSNVVNPCREILGSFGVADPTAALQSTFTTGGAARLGPDGIEPGPQNVFNGDTTKETAKDGGQVVAVSTFLKQNTSVNPVTVGTNTYLPSRFNGQSRLERALTMIHERVVHVANDQRDNVFAPQGSTNPRTDGSHKINDIIRLGCNQLTR